MTTTPKRLKAMCDEAIANLRLVSVDGPDLLVMVADEGRGYPTSSRGVEGRGIGGHSDPTCLAAIADPEHDPVGHAVVVMAELVEQILVLSRQARGRRDFATPRHRPDEQAPGSGHCESCSRYCPGGPDRLRAAYCRACYDEWLKQGRPDRGSYRYDPPGRGRWAS